MNHPLQCRCGSLKGYVTHPESANRCMCYCRSCQAFAHFLGRADDILDVHGGTDVIQISPAQLTFTQGRASLACMRLTEKGLLRWYAACCNTPIGNTLPNYRMSFVGLVHNCLEGTGHSLNDSFGPVRIHVNTKSAKGSVRSGSTAATLVILRVLAKILLARADGSYKRTPFFSVETGSPIANPKVLSRGERDEVMSR
jgi:hypothetical protein